MRYIYIYIYLLMFLCSCESRDESEKSSIPLIAIEHKCDIILQCESTDKYIACANVHDKNYFVVKDGNREYNFMLNEPAAYHARKHNGCVVIVAFQGVYKWDNSEGLRKIYGEEGEYVHISPYACSSDGRYMFLRSSKIGMSKSQYNKIYDIEKRKVYPIRELGEQTYNVVFENGWFSVAYDNSVVSYKVNENGIVDQKEIYKSDPPGCYYGEYRGEKVFVWDHHVFVGGNKYQLKINFFHVFRCGDYLILTDCNENVYKFSIADGETVRVYSVEECMDSLDSTRWRGMYRNKIWRVCDDIMILLEINEENGLVSARTTGNVPIYVVLPAFTPR